MERHGCWKLRLLFWPISFLRPKAIMPFSAEIFWQTSFLWITTSSGFGSFIFCCFRFPKEAFLIPKVKVLVWWKHLQACINPDLVSVLQEETLHPAETDRRGICKLPLRNPLRYVLHRLWKLLNFQPTLSGFSVWRVDLFHPVIVLGSLTVWFSTM